MGRIHCIATVLFTLVASNVLAGPTITLTVHSVPEGAAVYANATRQSMGVTPLTIPYPRKWSRKCEVTQPIEVRWASGATAMVPGVSLCWKQGKRQMITLTRPADAPNGDIDLNAASQRMYALQGERKAAQRAAEINAAARAAADAPEQASWANALAIQANLRILMQPYQLPMPRPSALCITRPVMRNTTYVWCQ